MNWLFKVKAGALQFTTFITVVIALLLAGFILLVHTHKKYSIKTDFIKEAIFNTEKGIDYLLQNAVTTNDTITKNLDQGFKIVKIHREYWGVFEKVSSTAQIKHNRFSKIALVGGLLPKLNRTALYIKDANKPLVVVGNTKIQGKVYLPKQGVRTGNVAGHSYYGDRLIYGSSQTSKNLLPQLKHSVLNKTKEFQNKFKTIQQDQFIDLNTKMKYENSFYNPLQIVYNSNIIRLSGVSLTGHILVQSKTKIVVDASSSLKDIILIAPEIEIKPHTKGTFQVIASKKITVGNNCDIGYPSALVLKEKETGISKKNNVKTSPFVIGKGSNLKGVIIYFGNTKDYTAQVFIDKGSKITGEVYCNKNLEVLGAVYGSVYTSSFVANQSGSLYQNHLYNATINVEVLPEEYVGLLFKDSQKGIAKWLY